MIIFTAASDDGLFVDETTLRWIMIGLVGGISLGSILPLLYEVFTYEWNNIGHQMSRLRQRMRPRWTVENRTVSNDSTNVETMLVARLPSGKLVLGKTS
jgi:hypothetical protein